MADVDELGIPRRTFYDWVDDGIYLRLQPSVYLAAAALDGLAVRRLAATLSAGDGAAISHMSAAHHLGLDGSRPPRSIDVFAARRRRGLEHVTWHTRAYDASVVMTVLGIPVTNGTRTVFDVASLGLPYEQFRRIASDLVRRRLTDERELRVDRPDWAGKRGVALVDRFLDEFSPLLPATRNEFEARFVRVTTAAGIAPTAMNHLAVDDDGKARYLDAVYLPERVPVELDSKAYHSRILDIRQDRLREQAVVLTGWRPFLRFSFWDLVRVPGLVVVEIRAALEAARALP